MWREIEAKRLIVASPVVAVVTSPSNQVLYLRPLPDVAPPPIVTPPSPLPRVTLLRPPPRVALPLSLTDQQPTSGNITSLGIDDPTFPKVGAAMEVAAIIQRCQSSNSTFPKGSAATALTEINIPSQNGQQGQGRRRRRRCGPLA